jgi:hypothetical protein
MKTKDGQQSAETCSGRATKQVLADGKIRQDNILPSYVTLQKHAGSTGLTSKLCSATCQRLIITSASIIQRQSAYADRV